MLLPRLLTAAVLSAALAAPALVAPRPIPPGPGAILDMLKGMLAAADKGDAKGVLDCLEQDGTLPIQLYTETSDGRPVTARGRTEVASYVGRVLGEMEHRGAKVVTTITQSAADCHSPELGFATLEFTRTITVKDQPEKQSSHRATVLVRYGKDRAWHWFHWHDSRGTAAAAPAPGKSAAK